MINLDVGTIKAAAALRRFLIAVGQSPADLRATPGDLARFDLCAWDGLFCGVQCVPSPIAVVER